MVAPMACRLVFVLAPRSALPQSGAGWQELVEAQSQSLGSGIFLRLFPAQQDWKGSLDDLIIEGKADISGQNPFVRDTISSKSEINKPLYDSFIPYIEPKLQWLAVYKVEGRLIDLSQAYPPQALDIESVECLDQFLLRDANNETCWFYPTEDGRYLSWKNRSRITLQPGFLSDTVSEDESHDYQRSKILLLWSLMADDQSLTCVGLTYKKRRIEWPLLKVELEPLATWRSFRVDYSSETGHVEESCITVFNN
jgi:hypothetical protein